LGLSWWEYIVIIQLVKVIISKDYCTAAAIVDHNIAITPAFGLRTLLLGHRRRCIVSGLNRINPLAAKILLIALLTLVLLVPAARVECKDYALLFGALAIFSLLAITMIATRKLDWYRVTAARVPKP
jgi:hypothetical protein